MLDVLNEFDLIQKLFCITTDNASNNGKLMKCLSRELAKLGIDWDPKTHHISCLNHVLHLAVTDFLKKIKALGPKTELRKGLKAQEDSDEEDAEEDADEKEDFFAQEDDEEGEEDESLDIGGFQSIMKKLRGTAKVCFNLDCSIQN